MFAPPLNLISLPQPTDILSGYPFSVYPILYVNWFAFLEGTLLPPKSRLEGTNGGAPIGWWKPKIAPTAFVAYYYDMGCCVDTQWHHGCSKDTLTKGFATSHPIHPAPIPPRLVPLPIPRTLSVSYTDKSTVKMLAISDLED